MSEPAPAETAHLTVRGAVVLGIGAMVGAGIFALLGQAGAVAGSAVWISFLLAGAMSATLGYTLVKFAMRWPSSGGLIVYLEHGFRSRRLVGVAAWLGYLTAIVVVGAMVAASFGDYAAVLLADAPRGAGCRSCAPRRWSCSGPGSRSPGRVSSTGCSRRSWACSWSCSSCSSSARSRTSTPRCSRRAPTRAWATSWPASP